MTVESAASTIAQRTGIRKRPLSERVEIGVGAFLFISVAIICLFALLFLSHTNRHATTGYELKILQRQRAELLREQEVLSMQIADLQSLAAMENDKTIRSMVKADRPIYIRYDTAVAKNTESQPDS